LSVIEALEAALARREAPPPEVCDASVAALACYRTGKCATLDEAFLLARSPGERDVRNVLALARRDAAIVAAVEHLRAAGDSHPADTLAAKLCRYREAAWRFDRLKDYEPKDTLTALLWRILRAKDATLRTRRIEKISAS